jgi:DNA-binding transcriptional MerR regulator
MSESQTTIKEILNRFPGLERYHLAWWEQKGYIQPKKVPKKRVSRRVYTEKDVEKIELMWKYTEKGFPPAAAHKQALKHLKAKDRAGVSVFSAPKITLFSAGTRVNTDKLHEIALRFRNIVRKKSPNLVIAISSHACLVVGYAISAKGFQTSGIAIVPIERSERHLLEVTIKALDLEDNALILHDGSSAIVEILKEILRIDSIPDILEVEIDELR